MFDSKSGIEEWPGGSEASPTWANRPVKILKKNRPGDVVNNDKSIVNVKDTNSSDQRASLASHVDVVWNVKDEGKFESNPTLSMPWCFELW